MSWESIVLRLYSTLLVALAFSPFSQAAADNMETVETSIITLERPVFLERSKDLRDDAGAHMASTQVADEQCRKLGHIRAIRFSLINVKTDGRVFDYDREVTKLNDNPAVKEFLNQTPVFAQSRTGMAADQPLPPPKPARLSQYAVASLICETSALVDSNGVRLRHKRFDF